MAFIEYFHQILKLICEISNFREKLIKFKQTDRFYLV